MSAGTATPPAPGPAAAYQYPSGHLSHLTPSQRTAFDKFKRICTERGVFRPGNDGEGQPASHDDATLLRYLRARRFELEGAFAQFKDTEAWRKENEIERVYERIDLDEYEATRRLYPQWTGRRDLRGMPLYVFEVGNLSGKDIAAYENSSELKGHVADGTKSSAKLLRLFALYENLVQFVTPWCSATRSNRPHPETPITQGNNIVDIGGVGLKQFWDLKAHLQDASTLATAHYPETLDRIFVIGAPSFFPTIWSWVKRWFDPIVVSKIFVLSHADTFPTLSQFVAPENIPKKYGGQLDFKFGDMPKLDPDMVGEMQWTGAGEAGLPKGPTLWRAGKDGGMELVAVGSVDGQARTDVVGRMERKWVDVFRPRDLGAQEVERVRRESAGGAPMAGRAAEQVQEAQGVTEAAQSVAGESAPASAASSATATGSVEGGKAGSIRSEGRASFETPSKATAPGPPVQ